MLGLQACFATLPHQALLFLSSFSVVRLEPRALGMLPLWTLPQSHTHSLPFSLKRHLLTICGNRLSHLNSGCPQWPHISSIRDHNVTTVWKCHAGCDLPTPHLHSVLAVIPSAHSRGQHRLIEPSFPNFTAKPVW